MHRIAKVFIGFSFMSITIKVKMHYRWGSGMGLIKSIIRGQDDINFIKTDYFQGNGSLPFNFTSPSVSPTTRGSQEPLICAFYNPDFIIYSSLGSFYIPCFVMIVLYTKIFKVSCYPINSHEDWGTIKHIPLPRLFTFEQNKPKPSNLLLYLWSAYLQLQRWHRQLCVTRRKHSLAM